jgi:hypothetical protein
VAQAHQEKLVIMNEAFRAHAQACIHVGVVLSQHLPQFDIIARM